MDALICVWFITPLWWAGRGSESWPLLWDGITTRAQSTANSVVTVTVAYSHGDVMNTINSITECHAHSVLDSASNTKVIAGTNTTLSGRDFCEFIAGKNAAINCQNNCVITADDLSSVVAGDFAVVSAGCDCDISVGPGSRVTARAGTVVTFTYWREDRQLTVSGIVGQTLKPGVTYHVRAGHIIPVSAAELAVL